MKKVLKIILISIFSTLTINAEKHSIEILKEIEDNFSCTKQYTKNNIKLEECIKKMIEIKINENVIQENNKVQLGVFSKEEDARKEVKKYNKEKEKISNLKTSKAYYILKEIKGHKKLKDGKYYVVFVIQKGVSTKVLQKKINKRRFVKSIISYKPKIIIDIDNKILKVKKKGMVDNEVKRYMADKRVKILKEKANCYTKYQENKELNQFMECLNKEVIVGMQIYALFSKDACEKIAKDYNEKNVNSKAQCILNQKIKNETYHTVVIAVESSNDKEKKKIKKKRFDAFPVKKPEILIK